MRARILHLILLATLAGAGCGSVDADQGDGQRRAGKPPATERGGARHLDLERVTVGLNRPTYVGYAPGDADALWVLEQPGRIVRVAGDGGHEVLLDMSGSVKLGAEQGLLGMAFAPDFAASRRLFLHWSDPAGDTRVAEFRARADGTVSPRPVRELLALDQPEENHNGGQLAFGPDGRLYLGLGDGGGAFDPSETAQDRDELLGKIVSIDVDEPRADWRVDLYGLRNPWRFSFDPALGEIWVGDVGQDEVEEIHRVLLEPDEPPKNLGWSVYEGVDEVGKGHELKGGGDLVWPVATYTHRDGCAVTGGHVYHGTDIPKLAGRYVYGDFCSGAIWTLRPVPGGTAADVRRERATVPQLSHIGQDADGRLTFASSSGAIYRAVAPAGR